MPSIQLPKGLIELLDPVDIHAAIVNLDSKQITVFSKFEGLFVSTEFSNDFLKDIIPYYILELSNKEFPILNMSIFLKEDVHDK